MSDLTAKRDGKSDRFVTQTGVQRWAAPSFGRGKGQHDPGGQAAMLNRGSSVLLWGASVVVGLTIVIVSYLFWVTYQPARRVSFTAIAAEQTALLLPFRSYTTVRDAQAVLGREGMTWKTEVSDLRHNPKDPPNVSQEVIVDRYLHLGIAGQLRLVFFNDRLMETVFVPGSPEVYLARLNAGLAVPLKPGSKDSSSVRLPPNTILTADLREGKLNSVSWADERLKEEQVLWFARYS